MCIKSLFKNIHAEWHNTAIKMASRHNTHVARNASIYSHVLPMATAGYFLACSCYELYIVNYYCFSTVKTPAVLSVIVKPTNPYLRRCIIRLSYLIKIKDNFSHVSLFKLLLTHWGRDKTTVSFLTTLSNAFSWMKMYKFQLRFHWTLFLRFELTILQHWFR